VTAAEQAGHEGEPVGKFGDGVVVAVVHENSAFGTAQSNKKGSRSSLGGYPASQPIISSIIQRLAAAATKPATTIIHRPCRLDVRIPGLSSEHIVSNRFGDTCHFRDGSAIDTKVPKSIREIFHNRIIVTVVQAIFDKTGVTSAHVSPAIAIRTAEGHAQKCFLMSPLSRHISIFEKMLNAFVGKHLVVKKIYGRIDGRCSTKSFIQ